MELDPVNPLTVYLSEWPYGTIGKAQQRWVALAEPVVIQMHPRAYLAAVTAAVEKMMGREFPPLRSDHTRKTVVERWIGGRGDEEGGREVAWYLYEVVSKHYQRVSRGRA